MDEDREEDEDSQKSEKEDIKRIKRGQVIQMSEEEKMEIKEGDEDGAMKVDDEQEIQNGEYESEIKDSGKRRTGKNRLQRITGGNRSPRKQRGRELVDTEDEESGLEEDSRDGTEGKTTESKEEGQVPLEEKEEEKIPSGKNEGSGSSKDQENKQLPPDSELEGETEWEEPPEEKSKSTETEVPKEIGRQANQEVSMGNIEQEVTTTKPPVDSMDDESVETQKRGGGTLDDDGPELEDDDNTVSSMQTFHRNSSKQADTVIEVPTIRYSFNFNLMEADIKALEKEFKKKGVPNEKTDTLLRMRNIFIELLKIAKEIDPNSDLLPWHAEEGDEKMGVVKGKEEEIPKTASALSTYFFNLQAGKVGRKYIKLRVTSQKFDKLEDAISKWAREESYSFNKCVVQAERECMIGWLVYSSQFTDTDYLRKILKQKTKHEWGFRLGAVTDRDIYEDGNENGKKTEWKNRIKAIFVHVPLEYQLTATQFIGEWLEPRKVFIPTRVPTFKDRLLFTLPEKEMAATPEEAMKYAKLVEKQSDHNRGLVAHLSVNIIVDIDKKICTKKGRGKSLREMILSIKTHNHGPTRGMNMFQSIDFTKNANRLYLNGRLGPRCSGYVITFYELIRGEAIQMLRGLGVYLLHMYGSQGIKECFAQKYWDGLLGWKWSKTLECFDRPEARQLHANVNNDPNEMVKLMGRMRLEKEKAELIEKQKKSLKEKEEIETTGQVEERMVVDLILAEEKGNGKQSTSDNIQIVGRKKNHLDLKGKEQDIEEGSVVTSVSNVLRQREIDRLRKRDDIDLDSNGGDRGVGEIVNDNVSVASSLTDNTGMESTIDQEMGETLDDQSTLSEDSQISFGEETMDRHKKIDSRSKGEKMKEKGKEFIRKIFNQGESHEDGKMKALQYIRRKATRDFQESTAAYQAVLDDVIQEKEQEKISQERAAEKSDDDDESMKTSNTFLEHHAPASSANAGEAP